MGLWKKLLGQSNVDKYEQEEQKKYKQYVKLEKQQMHLVNRPESEVYEDSALLRFVSARFSKKKKEKPPPIPQRHSRPKPSASNHVEVVPVLDHLSQPVQVIDEPRLEKEPDDDVGKQGKRKRWKSPTFSELQEYTNTPGPTPILLDKKSDALPDNNSLRITSDELSEPQELSSVSEVFFDCEDFSETDNPRRSKDLRSAPSELPGPSEVTKSEVDEKLDFVKIHQTSSSTDVAKQEETIEEENQFVDDRYYEDEQQIYGPYSTFEIDNREADYENILNRKIQTMLEGDKYFLMEEHLSINNESDAELVNSAKIHEDGVARVFQFTGTGVYFTSSNNVPEISDLFEEVNSVYVSYDHEIEGEDEDFLADQNMMANAKNVTLIQSQLSHEQEKAHDTELPQYDFQILKAIGGNREQVIKEEYEPEYENVNDGPLLPVNEKQVEAPPEELKRANEKYVVKDEIEINETPRNNELSKTNRYGERRRSLSPDSLEENSDEFEGAKGENTIINQSDKQTDYINFSFSNRYTSLLPKNVDEEYIHSRKFKEASDDEEWGLPPVPLSKPKTPGFNRQQVIEDEYEDSVVYENVNIDVQSARVGDKYDKPHTAELERAKKFSPTDEIDEVEMKEGSTGLKTSANFGERQGSTSQDSLEDDWVTKPTTSNQTNVHADDSNLSSSAIMQNWRQNRLSSVSQKGDDTAGVKITEAPNEKLDKSREQFPKENETPHGCSDIKPDKHEHFNDIKRLDASSLSVGETHDGAYNGELPSTEGAFLQKDNVDEIKIRQGSKNMGSDKPYVITEKQRSLSDSFEENSNRIQHQNNNRQVDYTELSFPALTERWNRDDLSPKNVEGSSRRILVEDFEDTELYFLPPLNNSDESHLYPVHFAQRTHSGKTMMYDDYSEEDDEEIVGINFGQDNVSRKLLSKKNSYTDDEENINFSRDYVHTNANDIGEETLDVAHRFPDASYKHEPYYKDENYNTEQTHDKDQQQSENEANILDENYKIQRSFSIEKKESVLYYNDKQPSNEKPNHVDPQPVKSPPTLTKRVSWDSPELELVTYRHTNTLPNPRNEVTKSLDSSPGEKLLQKVSFRESGEPTVTNLVHYRSSSEKARPKSLNTYIPMYTNAANDNQSHYDDPQPVKMPSRLMKTVSWDPQELESIIRHDSNKFQISKDEVTKKLLDSAPSEQKSKAVPSDPEVTNKTYYKTSSEEVRPISLDTYVPVNTNAANSGTEVVSIKRSSKLEEISMKMGRSSSMPSIFKNEVPKQQPNSATLPRAFGRTQKQAPIGDDELSRLQERLAGIGGLEDSHDQIRVMEDVSEKVKQRVNKFVRSGTEDEYNNLLQILLRSVRVATILSCGFESDLLNRQQTILNDIKKCIATLNSK